MSGQLLRQRCLNGYYGTLLVVIRNCLRSRDLKLESGSATSCNGVLKRRWTGCKSGVIRWR